MVTKPYRKDIEALNGSVLAKIHMVTKLCIIVIEQSFSSVLAKIHMVTKPQKYGSTFLNVIEY